MEDSFGSTIILKLLPKSNGYETGDASAAPYAVALLAILGKKSDQEKSVLRKEWSATSTFWDAFALYKKANFPIDQQLLESSPQAKVGQQFLLEFALQFGKRALLAKKEGPYFIHAEFLREILKTCSDDDFSEDVLAALFAKEKGVAVQFIENLSQPQFFALLNKCDFVSLKRNGLRDFRTYLAERVISSWQKDNPYDKWLHEKFTTEKPAHAGLARLLTQKTSEAKS